MNKIIFILTPLFLIHSYCNAISLSVQPGAIEKTLNANANSISKTYLSTKSFGKLPEDIAKNLRIQSEEKEADIYIVQPKLSFGNTPTFNVSTNTEEQSMTLQLSNSPLELKTSKLFLGVKNFDKPVFPNHLVPSFSSGSQMLEINNLSLKIEPDALKALAKIIINPNSQPPKLDLDEFNIDLLDLTKVDIDFDSLENVTQLKAGGAQIDKDKLKQQIKNILLENKEGEPFKLLMKVITDLINKGLKKKISELIDSKVNPLLSDQLSDSNLPFILKQLEITQNGNITASASVDYCPTQEHVPQQHDQNTSKQSSDVQVIVTEDEVNHLIEDLLSPQSTLGENLSSPLMANPLQVDFSSSGIKIGATVKTPNTMNEMFSNDVLIEAPIHIATDGNNIELSLGEKSKLTLPLQDNMSAEIDINFDKENNTIKTNVSEQSLNNIAETVLKSTLDSSFKISKTNPALQVLDNNEFRVNTDLSLPISILPDDIRLELQEKFNNSSVNGNKNEDLQFIKVSVDLKAQYQIINGELVFSFIPYPTTTLKLPNDPASQKSTLSSLGARALGIFTSGGAQAVIQKKIEATLAEKNVSREVHKALEDMLNKNNKKGLYSVQNGERPKYSNETLPALESRLANLESQSQKEMSNWRPIGPGATPPRNLSREKEISDLRREIKTLDVKKATQLKFDFNTGPLADLFTIPLKQASKKYVGSEVFLSNIRNIRTDSENTLQATFQLDSARMSGNNLSLNLPVTQKVKEISEKAGAPIDIEVQGAHSTDHSLIFDVQIK